MSVLFSTVDSVFRYEIFENLETESPVEKRRRGMIKVEDRTCP